jgi:fumagillin biosynthesis dioxygenase
MTKDEIREQLDEQGFCIIPNVLGEPELRRVQATIERLIATSASPHQPSLDPNEANIRLHNLPVLDSVFIDLLCDPTALDIVESLLGPGFLVSNFSGNIALPGSRSMRLHSDQALVIPPPWLHPWAINVIWCVDDVHARNGATRYLPGSHLYKVFEDVPADALSQMRPFEAPAGSVIAMEGRLWHTSGANVTADQRRGMLFAYYSSDFVRGQMNWEAAFSEETKVGLDPYRRQLFGLGLEGNTRIARTLVMRDDSQFSEPVAG